MSYVGRLAPSPTGALHLGNVRTFMVAYLRARSLGGRLILRIEDLDHPKVKMGASAKAIEDLRWLGFDWDEGPYVQSERRVIYREYFARLRACSLVYPCICTRKDVENGQSAPHAGETLKYDGRCRGQFASYEEAIVASEGRLPAWRFLVTDEVVHFTDIFAGYYEQNIAEYSGDFVVARDADGAGYMLATPLDDALMGVTEVVRGDDLLPATPRQLLIFRALGFDVPDFLHVPLVVGSDGRRLAKRHGDTRVSYFRELGILPESIIGYLAHSLGMAAEGEKISLKDLILRFNLSLIPKEPLVVKQDICQVLRKNWG